MSAPGPSDKTSMEVEKKLTLSLDDLIAQQKKVQQKSQLKGKAPKARPGQQQQQPFKRGAGQGGRGGGRGPAAAMNRVRSGGVNKAGAPRRAPFMAVPVRGRAAYTSRGMKVLIVNRTHGGGQQPAYPQPAGYPARSYQQGTPPGRGSYRAPAMAGPEATLPPGASLGSRFDQLSGVAPPPMPRGRGSVRRNVHGVIIP